MEGENNRRRRNVRRHERHEDDGELQPHDAEHEQSVTSGSVVTGHTADHSRPERLGERRGGRDALLVDRGMPAAPRGKSGKERAGVPTVRRKLERQVLEPFQQALAVSTSAWILRPFTHLLRQAYQWDQPGLLPTTRLARAMAHGNWFLACMAVEPARLPGIHPSSSTRGLVPNFIL